MAKAGTSRLIRCSTRRIHPRYILPDFSVFQFSVKPIHRDGVEAGMNPNRSLLFPRRFLLACLTLAFTGLVFAADPSGTWIVQQQSAEGRQIAATIKLQLRNGKLTGTVGGGRLDPVEISNASFKDDTVTFTVKRTIGRFLRKKTFTTHYTAKVGADELKGTLKLTGRDGQPHEVPFTARRS